MQQSKSYYTAEEVAQIIGTKTCTGYKVIRELNAELKAKGFITIAGKVSVKYFDEKYYGGVEA
ncbi:MAG TPA: transcriptional regulator [Clostridiales bacterium]|nr:transcriptional regulator [Clostridiales bacterium]